MSMRVKISVILILLGITAFILPERDNDLKLLSPDEYLEYFQSNKTSFSPDEVAAFIVNEDSSVQLIDLRSKEEFLESNIPGAINIPFDDLFNPDLEGFLDQSEVKNILYSKDDIIATEALSLMVLSGYRNNYIMEGGMEKWIHDIMRSEFTGESISPKENKLFETRYRARRFFNQMNSLPDSMKIKYLEIKKAKENDLVGGCE